MKKCILIILILFLIGCSQNPKNGRYQLQWHNGYVFIIDTQTGTIWQRVYKDKIWIKYELKDSILISEKKEESPFTLEEVEQELKRRGVLK